MQVESGAAERWDVVIAGGGVGGMALGTTLSLETIMLLIAVPAVLVALLILWLGAVNRRAPVAGLEPVPA